MKKRARWRKNLDPEVAREAARIARRNWHIQFTLPWEVWVNGLRIARFRDERDARGFAKARFGANATIENMQID